MNEMFLYSAIGFAVALFFYNFRNEAADLLYKAVKQWKQTSFILFCVAAGLFMGAYASHADRPGIPSLSLQLPAMNHGTTATIQECKTFVLAKLENKTGYVEPSPPLGDVLKIGARSYWDTCAQAFGTNYWKHDISINGENGGRVLCRAYRQDSYRSGNVETWCNTVFAPQQKI